MNPLFPKADKITKIPVSLVLTELSQKEILNINNDILLRSQMYDINTYLYLI